LPWRAGAEDKRFELVRGCPQHAFQVSARAFGGDHGRPNLRRRGLPPPRRRTVLNGGECNWNCNCARTC
jgi:hypothetical protein